MPNLPTHLFIAQAALNQITDDSIRKHESFYLLGSTAPDIKALSKTPREQSHFVKLNSFVKTGVRVAVIDLNKLEIKKPNANIAKIIMLLFTLFIIYIF